MTRRGWLCAAAEAGRWNTTLLSVHVRESSHLVGVVRLRANWRAFHDSARQMWTPRALFESTGTSNTAHL